MSKVCRFRRACQAFLSVRAEWEDGEVNRSTCSKNRESVWTCLHSNGHKACEPKISMSSCVMDFWSLGLSMCTEIHQLLFLEAGILDEHRFEEWLNLYSSDCTYCLPLELNQKEALNTSSIICDDKTLMEIRIRQYAHARPHARNPLSRIVHAISNLCVESRQDTSFKVFSNLIVGE